MPGLIESHIISVSIAVTGADIMELPQETEIHSIIPIDILQYLKTRDAA